MKKLFLLLSFLFVLIIPLGVSASTDYKINSFNSEITLNQDTSLTVSETIDVTFLTQKHGIFRTVPLIYSASGKTINAKLEVISVKNEFGNSYQFTTARRGQSIEIKIGDPDKTITGSNTYEIMYQIEDVIQSFDDHEELYWNVTGSERDTKIETAAASVKSPYAEISKLDCFSGSLRSTQKLCSFDQRGNTAIFVSETTLGTGKDFTIVVGFAKNNQLVFPTPVERFFKTAYDNWMYLIAVLPLAINLVFWNKKGRDRRYLSENIYYQPDDTSSKTVALFARRHIPLVYHPIDGLSPAEVGTITDERVNIHDVVAEILELARLSFIKIQKLEVSRLLGKDTDYLFIQDKKYNNSEEKSKLKDYQKYLLKELFRSDVVHKSVSIAEKLLKKNPEKLKDVGKVLEKNKYVLLSALKNHFYKGLPEFKKKLYTRMQAEGFFAGDPDKTRQKWMGIFVLQEIAAAFMAFSFGISTFNFGPLVLFVILSPLAFILAYSMPRRTPKGYSLFRQIEGLKWYLGKGKWRYKVAEKRLFIEEILPLAVALGIVNRLAKDMKELGIIPPSYFVGSNAALFSRDIGMFSKSANSSLVSAPGGTGSSSWSGGSGFSGGGFSGGGFGGGGGGSW